MNEWQWWDWSFALKLLWHGAVFGGAFALVTTAIAFRWAWRRGIEIEKMRKEVTERAAEKLAKEREERVS